MMDFFSKLAKKERIGLFVASVVVLITLADRLVISPIRGMVGKLNREIEMCEEELRRDIMSLNEKKAITKEYEKYTQYVTKAGSDEEEVSKILAEIEEIARKSEVNLVDITPQAPREVDFYREYAAEIEVEGRTASIVSFLYRLSNSTLLLRAQKLRINLKTSDSVGAFVLVTKILIS